MRGIGGNLVAEVQTSTTTKNEIGEAVKSWQTVQQLKGWLDLASGDSKYTSFNTKLQESTHIFIADYVNFPLDLEPENCRLIIKGKRYDVMLIDNPMELGFGSQLEIYVKYVGGQS